MVKKKSDLALSWFVLTVWVLAMFAVGVAAGVLSRPAPQVLVPVWPVLVVQGRER